MLQPPPASQNPEIREAGTAVVSCCVENVDHPVPLVVYLSGYTKNLVTGPGSLNREVETMKLLRSLYFAFFGHYADARSINGGSGHYNEQCHPGTYG